MSVGSVIRQSAGRSPDSLRSQPVTFPPFATQRCGIARPGLSESRDSFQDSECFGAVNGAKLNLRSARKSHGLIAQNLVHHVLVVPTDDSLACFGLIEPSPNRPPKVLIDGLLS